MADSIKVAVRLRKLIQREEEQKCECRWFVKDGNVCEIDGKTEGNKYMFDCIFDQHVPTEDIYDELIAPILEDAMSGINGTVFAYGQTASGKTYTMLGTRNALGIIPMCITDIYNTIEHTPGREFLIRISYVEIYNEFIADLLGDTKKSLNVYDTVDGQVAVKDVTEEVVTSADQIVRLLKKGERARHYGATNMNEKSSRSHTIFRVIIESRERVMDPRDSFDGAVMVAHLNLVDLAGSENAKLTGATGQRLAEGGHINKSLFTLGQVITQLSSNAQFVSYRDSKLTRILQNSLGGNSKTAVICTVTPAALEETHSTLRFATSAKRVKNRPIVNEILSDEALMRRMQQEIAELKSQLEKKNQEDKGLGKIMAFDSMQTEKQQLQQKLAEKERLQKEQDEKIQRLTALISVSSVLPAENAESRSKKKRRETWCPGKGRQSLGQKAFQKVSSHYSGSTAPAVRCLPNLIEESDVDSFDEDDSRRSDLFFNPAIVTDDEFRSVTHSVDTQTDPITDDAVDQFGDDANELHQQVKDQDEIIEQLKEALERANAELGKVRSSGEKSVPQSDDTCGSPVQPERSTSSALPEEVPGTSNSDDLKETEKVVDERLIAALGELESLKEQLMESMMFSASLVEKNSQMKVDLNTCVEDRNTLDEAYNCLKQELDELQEFTRYEKELRDASILERQEESQRELVEQVISLEAQLKMSRNQEQMLTAALNEQFSQVDKPDELRSKIEKLTVSVSDMTRQLMLLETARDELLEDKRQLLERVEILQDATKEQDTSSANQYQDKMAELEQEKTDQQRRVAELEEGMENLKQQLESRSSGMVAPPDNKMNEQLLEEIRHIDGKLKLSFLENSKLKEQLKEQTVLAIDAQNELLDQQDMTFNLKKKFEETENKIKDLEGQLKAVLLEKTLQAAASAATSMPNIATEKTNECDTAPRKNLTSVELMDDKQAFRELQKKCEKVTAELKATKDQLLLYSNKDIDAQKCRSSLEQVIKDMNTAVTQSNQESKTLVDRLNKEVHDLSCQLQKTSCDLQLIQHRLTEAEAEKLQLKAEVQRAEGMVLRQESQSRGGLMNMDAEKLREHIKKLTNQNDLTSQRCQNYEIKVKSMEANVQKFETVQIERNSLQVQLREMQQQLKQTREDMVRLQQARNNSYTETAQMALHVSGLESKILNITKQKEQLESQLETRKTEKLELTAELDRLTQERHQVAAEMTDIKRQLQELMKREQVMKPNQEEVDRNLASKVEEGRQLECKRWETLLEKKVEALRKEEEKKRHDEIISIQQEAMEKLNGIVDNLKEEKRQTIAAVQEESGREIKEMQCKLKSAEEKLQQNMADLKRKNEELESIVHEHSQNVEDLRHRFEQEIVDMDTILTKKESEIEDLEQKLKEICKEAELTRHQLEANCLPRKDDEISAELRQQLITRQEEIGSLNEKLEKLNKSHQEELAKTIANHELHLEELSKNSSHRLLVVQEQLNEVNNLHTEDLRKKELAVAALTEKLEILTEEKKQLAIKTDELERERTELGEMVESMKKKSMETDESLKRIEAEYSSALVHVSEKERDISALRQENSELQRRIGCLKEQVDLLEQEMVSSEDEYKCSLAKADSKIKDLTRDLQGKAAQLSHLEMESKRQEAEISTANRNNMEVSDALAKKTKEAIANFEEISRLNNISSQLTEKILALNQEIDEIRREYGSRSLEGECHALSTERNELNLTVSSIKAELAQVNLKLSTAEQELINTKEELKKQSTELKSQVEEEQVRCRELEESVKKLNGEKAKLEFEVNDLEKFSNENVEELSMLKNFLADTQEKERQLPNRAALESDVVRLRKERNELRVKVKGLETQAFGLGVDVKLAEKACESAKSELNKKMERLQKQIDKGLEAELKEKNDEIAHLNLKVNELETKLLTAVDPLKSRIRLLMRQTDKDELEIKNLEDEIKRLKAMNLEKAAQNTSTKSVSEPVESRSSPRTADSTSVGTVSGSGVISDFMFYRMRAENDVLKKSNSKLSDELTTWKNRVDALKSKEDSLKKEILDLKHLVTEKDSKLSSYTTSTKPEQGVAIASVGSPEASTIRQDVENQAAAGPSPIDFQRWMRGSSHPYDKPVISKEDCDNCKMQ